MANEFSLRGENPNVTLGNQHGDNLAPISVPHANVVEATVIAQGDISGVVYLVVTNTEVGGL